MSVAVGRIMSFSKYLAFFNSNKCIMVLFPIESYVIIHSYQLVTLVAMFASPWQH